MLYPYRTIIVGVHDAMQDIFYKLGLLLEGIRARAICYVRAVALIPNGIYYEKFPWHMALGWDDDINI